MFSAIVRRDKKGFTLIELVIVIVLIGILAATALPKFANLTVQARDAANQGVAGGLAAAVAIAHAAWIAAGATSTVGSDTNITLEGNIVPVNSNGWPDGGVASVSTPTAAGCALLWTQILNNPPPALASGCTTASTTGCYSITVSAPSCVFTLPNNTAITITYNIGTGAVTTTSQ